MADPGQISNIAQIGESFSGAETVVANGQNTSVTVTGATPSVLDILGIAMDQGDFFTDDDNAGIARVAVLGPQVVTDLFGEGANPVGKSIEIGTKPFRVVGVTAPKSSVRDNSIYIPLTTATRVMFGVDYVQGIYITIKDARLLDQTEADAKQIIFERHTITDQSVKDHFRATSSRDIQSAIDSVLSVLTIVLSGIAGISLVVGGIGIMNIMLVTVTERTKEIGLLKAIGAKRKDILTQFLLEAVILTVAGGLVGITLGVSIGYVIANAVHVPFTLPIGPIGASVSVSIIIGVVFGIYPAYRAAKLSPIDALHYE